MTTAAARMRKSREREREGRYYIGPGLELDDDDIDALIEARTLDPRSDFHTRVTALRRAGISSLRPDRPIQIGGDKIAIIGTTGSYRCPGCGGIHRPIPLPTSEGDHAHRVIARTLIAVLIGVGLFVLLAFGH